LRFTFIKTPALSADIGQLINRVTIRQAHGHHSRLDGKMKALSRRLAMRFIVDFSGFK
jgi:hypothetical protein